MRRRTLEPLAGRTAVITGAASGIGRALAQRLARAGSPVAITDIDEDGLRETSASLGGAPVLGRVTDVRDAAAMTSFARDVAAWAPAPIGAVVNNAGVAVGASVLDGAVADDTWLHEVNFVGVVNGTRAFLPLLAAQDAGTIVNLSSVFGLAGIPNQSAYCAAKFAVRGFTEALRHELRGTGVRAITVHPGGVDTGIIRHGRFHRDPAGLGRTPEQQARDFAAITRTTPDRAAEVIHRGIDRGRARILIGPDAYLFDAVTRITPVHAVTVLSAVRKIASRRTRAHAGPAAQPGEPAAGPAGPAPQRQGQGAWR